MNQHVATLVAEYGKGDLKISDKQMRGELKHLETRVTDLQSMLIILRSQKNQIAGELVDQSELESSELESSKDATDWARINPIISRYRNPQKATLPLFKRQDVAAQNRFQTNVLTAYNAQDPDRAWCCVTGQRLGRDWVGAAHIVPYNIGENNAAYLFGKADHQDGHLMSPANGLPMKKEYKERFDDASIGFIPVPGTNDLKIVAFDRDPDDEMKPLHGKVLRFQNDFRPAKRYLYFAFVSSVLRRQRHEAPGWWRDRFDFGLQEDWAIRHSTLLTLAHRIGHMLPEEALALVGVKDRLAGATHDHPDPNFEDTRNRLVSDSVQLVPGIARREIQRRERQRWRGRFA